MNFSALFGIARRLQNTHPGKQHSLQITPDHSRSNAPKSGANHSNLDQSAVNQSEILLPAESWLLPFQRAWIDDSAMLRIWEKSRQIGATKTDALDSVLKTSAGDARLDVWVTSSDEAQALLYMDDCRDWAKLLHLTAIYRGMLYLDRKHNTSAHVLQFANHRKIYCLSSNPNALAGKRGHVKIDEFALHPDQRALFKVAFPVTTWGGSLSILSTHRGPNSYFNQLIQDTLHHGNPMGWSHHKTTIHDAINDGIVERINDKTGHNESREQWETRTHSQCGTEEVWNEEYCCIPGDESSAFLTYDMIAACEDPNLHLFTTVDALIHSLNSQGRPPGPTLNHDLYLGLDPARDNDLCVIDVGAKIDGIMHDRLRLELHKTPFHVTEHHLYRLL